MPALEAISEPTLIWLAPPKMMPFWLITSTWPSALMLPRIWLGPRLPVTRLSAVQVALPCWLKLTVVRAPTLKVCQLRIACGAVWLTVTLVWPLLADWVGTSAPLQRKDPGRAPGAICSPPGARPFGTTTCGKVTERCAAPAAPRAAACTACRAWIACVARASAVALCLATAAACCAAADAPSLA